MSEKAPTVLLPRDIDEDTTSGMNAIQSQGIYDSVTALAIQEAGGQVFGDSIVEDFDDVPEGVNPHPISVAKRN